MPTTTTATRPHRLSMKDRGDAIAAFRAENARWPSQMGKTVRERTLYGYVRQLRTAHGDGKVTASEVRYLCKAVPGWDAPMSRQDDWEAKAAQTAAFVIEHGRLPRGNRGTEGVLASWVQRCRQGAERPLSGTRVDDERRAFLDQHVRGWDVPGDVAALERWHENVKAIAEHKANMGRWPSGNSVDRSEASLAGFRSGLRAKRRGKTNPPLTAEQIMHLNATIPGWMDLRDQSSNWFENGRLAAQFIAGRGRVPRQTASDPLERALGRWLGDVRAAATSGRTKMRLDAERIAYLDEILPGWQSTKTLAEARRAA